MDQISRIRKIRNYSLISFLLPLITINLCLFIFQILGNNELYNNFNWNDEKKEYSPKEYFSRISDSDQLSFTNCPKYKYSFNYFTSDGKMYPAWDEIREDLPHLKSNDGTIDYSPVLNLKDFEKVKIKSVKLKYEKKLNYQCVKNSKFSYFFLDIFDSVEKILVNTKKGYSSGFGQIRNPYLYGEVSISRTARYYPGTLIFKPLIILSAIFLLLYWINNLSLFKNLENNNILNGFSKKFFYLGMLSCLFLVLHASFLGLDFESKLFAKMRRLIIILFIFFEVFAQIFLTINLFKFKKNLRNFINPLILKIKIIFVITTSFTTCVLAALLIWGDLSGSFKHVLEWNYFSILLIYYMLSRLLWKKRENPVHTPEGA